MVVDIEDETIEYNGTIRKLMHNYWRYSTPHKTIIENKSIRNHVQ